MSLFNSFTLTVKRTLSGSYNDSTGKWEEPAPSTFSIQTSWQSANGKDLETLEEGKRISGIYKIYPNTQLFATDPKTQQKADIVVGPDGYDYEVITTGDWQNNIINHYKCMVVRIKEGV